VTLSQALTELSSRYVVGCVGYYSTMTPDPWQAAHDELGLVAGSFDKLLVDGACNHFLIITTQLIDRYVAANRPKPAPQITDAFHCDTVEKFNAAMSVKHKHCALCEKKGQLRVVPITAGSARIMLVCQECFTKGRPSA